MGKEKVKKEIGVRTNKTIVAIVFVTVMCIVASVSATYYFYNEQFQIEKSELNEALTNVTNSLSNTQNSLSNTQNILSNTQNELKRVENILADSISELGQVKNSLTENITELEELRSGNRYETHDPTYIEVVGFIHADRTNDIAYDEETFNCLNYATEVNKNAENLGIRCHVVELTFEIYAHTLIGFSTTNKGMVYIEPQSDEWVENLEIGNDYWTDCVVPRGGYYYEEHQDDTIKRILTYW